MLWRNSGIVEQFDSSTGSLTMLPVSGSVTAVDVSGNHCIVGTLDGNLYLFDIHNSGRLLWRSQQTFGKIRLVRSYLDYC